MDMQQGVERRARRGQELAPSVLIQPLVWCDTRPRLPLAAKARGPLTRRVGVIFGELLAAQRGGASLSAPWHTTRLCAAAAAA